MIKVYDEKGRTVLKRRILDHLKVRKEDLILADLRNDGTMVLKPLKKEHALANLKRIENEEKVLGEKTKIRYDLY